LKCTATRFFCCVCNIRQPINLARRHHPTHSSLSGWVCVQLASRVDSRGKPPLSPASPTHPSRVGVGWGLGGGALFRRGSLPMRTHVPRRRQQERKSLPWVPSKPKRGDVHIGETCVKRKEAISVTYTPKTLSVSVCGLSLSLFSFWFCPFEGEIGGREGEGERAR